ncbi:MAG: hypothetical protein IKL20_03295 [Alistipes sp.]|nr:hypothetical protein [Alistipes sp.]
MIQEIKRCLLHLVCVMALAVGATSCEGIEITFGGGGDDDNNNNNNNNTQVDVSLTRCWRLVSFCGAPADVDILIDFAKDGKFTIYQRSEELSYTVFKGTYTTDEEKKQLSGVYDDGVKWATDYIYEVNTEAEELTLVSVKNPAEVAIYEIADAPVTKVVNLRNAMPNDVKPL